LTKFIHTSDWQLGMTRRFLGDGAHELYDQARFDAIRAIGGLAEAERCDFVVVAGDVFESNRIGRKTLLRALEALRQVPVPVYLLPGNHDPLAEGSVYRSRRFADNKPDNVTVLADPAPLTVSTGVEVTGAPWRSKRPARNPVLDLLDALEPAGGALRVCVAHGGVLGPFNPGDECAIPVDALEQAVRDGKIHYVALGDRHSGEQLDSAGRVWYSGTPEVVAFNEVNPGFVNVVDLDHDRAAVRRERIGAWRFEEIELRNLLGGDDLAGFFAQLSAHPSKDTTAVRLKLSGTLGVEDMEALGRRIEDFRDLFASFEVEEDIRLNFGDRPDADENLGGFGAAAAAELRDRIAAGGVDAPAAQDALLLLFRLAREEAR
jgi:DNA repair exonuclease SbcCD nuclease subunit